MKIPCLYIPPPPPPFDLSLRSRLDIICTYGIVTISFRPFLPPYMCVYVCENCPAFHWMAEGINRLPGPLFFSLSLSAFANSIPIGTVLMNRRRLHSSYLAVLNVFYITLLLSLCGSEGQKCASVQRRWAELNRNHLDRLAEEERGRDGPFSILATPRAPLCICLVDFSVLSLHIAVLSATFKKEQSQKDDGCYSYYSMEVALPIF